MTAAAEGGDAPVPLPAWVTSARVQSMAVIAATIVCGGWHWANDGLWFQGDAPRHALTGVFVWDALTALPTDPLGYALGYFVRYPALVFGAYPPLFHLVEAVAFGLAGPSAYVAKLCVLAASGVVGFYTMAWGRRSIAPIAGWAGACAVLVPWMVEYANGVLLNVPATAAGLGALYHGQAWIDGGGARERTRFLLWALAAVGTYLPGGIVLPIALVWLLAAPSQSGGRVLWVPVVGVAAAVAAMALALPQYLARHGPSFGRLVDPASWRFYLDAAPRGLGSLWLTLAIVGLAGSLMVPAERRSALRLGLAMMAALATLAVLPAHDPRYALILAPIVVLSAFHAVSRAVQVSGRWRRTTAPALIAALLAAAVASALAVHVPRVSGIVEVARYLRAHGPDDAVLYSGVYDGVFTFHVRALDPRYQRRVVLAHRLLSDLRQHADFSWQETTVAASPAEVVHLVRQRCGCRWVAIEADSPWVTGGERQLREAVRGPEFAHVQTFAIDTPRGRRIELYRVRAEVAPEAPQDLGFPSYSTRVFLGVRPIPTRP